MTDPTLYTFLGLPRNVPSEWCRLFTRGQLMSAAEGRPSLNVDYCKFVDVLDRYSTSFCSETEWSPVNIRNSARFRPLHESGHRRGSRDHQAERKSPDRHGGTLKIFSVENNPCELASNLGDHNKLVRRSESFEVVCCHWGGSNAARAELFLPVSPGAPRIFL